MTGRSLLEWFRKNARDLPWRSEARDPYEVVVSEFMLQQTQVDRVVPRFESFVRRFPTVASLAAAAEDEVVEEWSGLGYYRRARMLHRLAQEVVGRADGFPQTAQELQLLPGIGPYTAAAVASLAFDEAVPVLDGNTMRVGARVLAVDSDPRLAAGRQRIGRWIAGLMEGESPGAVNEALMELGATVCAPTQPDCRSCPLALECGARSAGRQEEIPPPRRRKATLELSWIAACFIDPDDSWLLRRIDEGPILRGLWLPPLAELKGGSDPVAEAAGLLPINSIGNGKTGSPIRHNITHRKIDVIPVRFAIDLFQPPSEAWRWVDPTKPGLPTSSLLAKLVEVLLG